MSCEDVEYFERSRSGGEICVRSRDSIQAVVDRFVKSVKLGFLSKKRACLKEDPFFLNKRRDVINRSLRWLC